MQGRPILIVLNRRSCCRSMCTDLHKVDIFGRLALTAVAAFGWAWLLQTFVFGILICISIYVHSFRLNFLYLVSLLWSIWIWFNRLLINVSRRVIYYTIIGWIYRWWRRRHNLLCLRDLQLHLLYLIHVLNLSFTQITLYLLILGCLALVFLQWCGNLISVNSS